MEEYRVPECLPLRRRCACSCVMARRFPRRTTYFAGLIACAGEPLNRRAWGWLQTYMAGDGNGGTWWTWWQTEPGGPLFGTPALRMRPSSQDCARPHAGLRCRCGGYRRHIRSGVSGIGDSRGRSQDDEHVLGQSGPRRRDWQDIPNAYLTGDSGANDEDGYISCHRPCG